MHQSCHHCDYDLIGLPDKGHCPECGQAYDKHSVYRSIQSHEPAFLRHIKWGVLAGFTLIVLLCGGVLSVKADNPWGPIAVSLFIAGISGFGAFAYWWADRQEKRESD